MHRTVTPALPIQLSLQLPPLDPAWREVTLLCRRICLLRERGEFSEAERLESTSLSAALALCRRSHTEPEIASRLSALFVAESERVATATLIAELLLPSVEAVSRPAALATVASLTPFDPAPDSSATIAIAPGATRPTAGTDIAGFIDQMLAMNDPAPSPSHRRAS